MYTLRFVDALNNYETVCAERYTVSRFSDHVLVTVYRTVGSDNGFEYEIFSRHSAADNPITICYVTNENSRTIDKIRMLEDAE